MNTPSVLIRLLHDAIGLCAWTGARGSRRAVLVTEAIGSAGASPSTGPRCIRILDAIYGWFPRHLPIWLLCCLVIVMTLRPATAQSAVSEREKSQAGLLEEVSQSWRRSAVSPVQAPGQAPGVVPLVLQQKLESIMIPAVSFANVELNHVVDALGALAEEFDTTNRSPKGVNIVLLDPANANPPVTITLRNVTL